MPYARPYRQRDRGAKRPLATFSELAAAATAPPATRCRCAQTSAAPTEAAQRPGTTGGATAMNSWGSAWPAGPGLATAGALGAQSAFSTWGSRKRRGSPASASSSSAHSEPISEENDGDDSAAGSWRNSLGEERAGAGPSQQVIPVAPLQLGAAQQHLLRGMRGPRSKRARQHACAAPPASPAGMATEVAGAGPDTPLSRAGTHDAMAVSGTTSFCWEPMGFEDGDGEPVVTDCFDEQAALGRPLDLFDSEW